MDSIKSIFFKPDPAAQMRKCNALIRANSRQLDRDMAALKALDFKTRNFILQASKRGQRNPSQAKQAAQETRTFARELIRIRKQTARLATSKAQLESVGMQVKEAFSVRKIEGSLKSSTGIMRDVNSLVRLPELTGTMRELSQELMKAGIIEEMVGDMMPDSELVEGEDELAEAEVEKVLGEVLQGKLGKVEDGKVVEEPAAEVSVGPAEEDEEPELSLEQMKGRLEALKS
ncbi:MAG: Vacuolar protein-sorting-associated protein 24 [Caeruleum heppii]|nr:MAG: Vacuolar protein-sorting-associated protein 24 [Caeruleum heppii]